MTKQRRSLVVAALAALITALCSGAAAVPASASTSAGVRPTATAAARTLTWGRASEDTSVTALGGNGFVVDTQSCGAPGNCAAGGNYLVSTGVQEAFVMNEVNGSWNSAEEVPGIAALNTDGYATVTTMSCRAPGDCSAGGYYQVSHNLTGENYQAFVVSETDGTWGSAVQVPGTETLTSGGYAEVYNMSCSSVGNCSADGFAGPANQQMFVVSEVEGTWGMAEMPPSPATNASPVVPTPIACTAPGNCSLGFAYGSKAYIMNQVASTWSKPEEVPGTSTLGGPVLLRAISCHSVGNCTAVGSYSSHGTTEGFTVSEVRGTWGRAHVLRMPAKGWEPLALSCPSTGNCTAGGTSEPFPGRPVVASEKHGTWEKPELARIGTALADHGKLHSASISSVSCWSAGNCSAVGGATGGPSVRQRQVFVIDEAHGVWGKAIVIPGIAALDTDHIARIAGVSCRKATCTAVGTYDPSLDRQLVFVVKTK